MNIREKGYHHWEGQLLTPRFRWLPIFWNGIKSLIQKKAAKSIMFFCLLPFVVFLIGIYISTKPELNMLRQLVSLLSSDAEYFKAFLTNNFLSFMMIMLAIILGSDLISGDIKYHSFPLYFSRPMDSIDYIMGKMSILLFYFLLITLVPGLLLYVFKFIFTGKVSIDLQLLLGLVFTPILTSFLIASLTLMISSFSGNGRYVKIMFFVVFFLSDIIGDILFQIFRVHLLHMFSIGSNIRQMGALLFNAKPDFDYPPVLSLLVVLLLSAGSFYVLFKRIKRAEAQIESGN